ncbi:sulfatase family protein [Puniceicoccus vermicola]|uniref:Sulfatase n=1 Tax=Puniceicoccus vermicola TaxID=388746 RepID=A0A7X1B056_9BACT|nr:sulfatase [Puniceicoccus vermicola]MBC2603176.1 sulfatase [Puniceicoccus vermicola]
MSQKPNIILINCDDLGYGDLGCYGSHLNQTPHIDALSRGGMQFTDFYMGSPVCSASRAAMLTGCYPQRVGFGSNPVLFPGDAVGLRSTESTIATQLKSASYATKIIGKWHCGDQPDFLPTRHGFDEYFGIPYSNDMGRQVNNPKNPPLPLVRNETVIQQQPDQRGITERYTDEALQFIRNHQERPFFLYLAHMYVHVPLFVPPQFLNRSQNGAYGAAVECIDWSTGILMDCLKKLGLFENTVILFTSDNGSRALDEGGSNGKCRGTKGTTWEGGQRVPCIIHWPARIQSGRVCSGVARSIDLLPTLSSIANTPTEPAAPIDGVDFSEYLFGQLEEYPNNQFNYYLWHDLEAIRIGHWKLHFSKRKHDKRTPNHELYNLSEDPSETTNVYEQYPDIVRELEERAQEQRERLGDEITGNRGSEVRPIGRVKIPTPLTEYDESHPYMIAMYDLPDMPTMTG